MHLYERYHYCIFKKDILFDILGKSMQKLVIQICNINHIRLVFKKIIFANLERTNKMHFRKEIRNIECTVNKGCSKRSLYAMPLNVHKSCPLVVDKELGVII